MWYLIVALLAFLCLHKTKVLNLNPGSDLGCTSELSHCTVCWPCFFMKASLRLLKFSLKAPNRMQVPHVNSEWPQWPTGPRVIFTWNPEFTTQVVHSKGLTDRIFLFSQMGQEGELVFIRISLYTRNGVRVKGTKHHIFRGCFKDV